MNVFLISFLLVALAVLGLSIGVVFGRKPIKGSCGGLNNVGLDGACEVCGGVPAKCPDATGKSANRP